MITKDIEIPAQLYMFEIDDCLRLKLRDYILKDIVKEKNNHLSNSSFLKYGPADYYEMHVKNGMVMGRNILENAHENSALTELVNLLTNNVIKICKLLNNTDTISFTAKVKGMTYISYGKNSFILPHNHFPRNFVASIYIDVDTNGSPLTFSEKYDIPVYNNLCVISPGLCTHSVCKTSSKRLMMAADIDVYHQSPICDITTGQ